MTLKLGLNLNTVMISLFTIMGLYLPIVSWGHGMPVEPELASQVIELNRKCGKMLVPPDLQNVRIESSSMMDLLNGKLAKVSTTDATVLLRGPTGSGKEVFARLIHYNGHRQAKTFIAVNMGGMDENLAQLELFGSKGSSFTGSSREDRKGVFELADGGTVFLDEIGDLAPAIQVKLLRLLGNQEIHPVGESRPRKVDVRIIAATHKDLGELVRAGKFREDLYYRLNTFPITLPPLRERREDIVPIANYYLEHYAKKYGRKLVGFEPAALEKLKNYDFPGNVRELIEIVDRAVILADGDYAYVRPDEIQKMSTISNSNPEFIAKVGLSNRVIDQVKTQLYHLGYTTNIEALQKAAILQALIYAPLTTTGMKVNVTQTGLAAEMVGYRRSTLQWNLHKSNFKNEYERFIEAIDEIKRATQDQLGIEQVRSRFENDPVISLLLSIPLDSLVIQELEGQAIRRLVIDSEDPNLFSDRSKTPANPRGLNLNFIARELGFFDNTVTLLNLTKKLGLDLQAMIIERDQIRNVR